MWLLDYLPEVEVAKRRLDLKTKLIWTLLVLIAYYLLALIPLYGLSPLYRAEFELVNVLLAAETGSIISLGIGPIVTGSMVLQLLVGGEIIKLDLTSEEGRKRFHALQKAMVIAFVLFQNVAYVLSGALPPATPSIANLLLLIAQLVMGSFALMMLDEVASKWGIGSGISLFIAAGVSRELLVGAFSLTIPPGESYPRGAIPAFFALLRSYPWEAIWPLLSIIGTIAVFLLSIYFIQLRVEIPLAFARFRGFSMRWPISFLYTTSMPIILTASLLASIQFWALMLYHAGIPLLGEFERVRTFGGYEEVPKSGLVKYLLQVPTIELVLREGLTMDHLLSILTYSIFMLIGCMLFSYIWISVGGQDPSRIAEQMIESGLVIPGFRAEKGVVQNILSTYIKPIALLGGLLVGCIAVLADLCGALTRGTGIFLTVMIMQDFYLSILRHHIEDLHPALRKVVAK